MNEQMTQDQALRILIQAVELAQSKGAFSLKDAAVLNEAVSVFVTEEEQAVEGEPQTEAPAETE